MEEQHEEVLRGISLLTEGSADERADVLASLVRKEERVLQTVDRVVNAARHRAVEATLFTNLSLTDLGRRWMHVLQLVMADLMRVRKPMDVVHALTDGERKVYVGLLMVAIAFVAAFGGAL